MQNVQDVEPYGNDYAGFTEPFLTSPLDKPWSATEQVDKACKEANPWEVNRTKQEGLLALQAKIKAHLGRAHLSAPEAVTTIQDEKTADLEVKLKQMLTARDNMRLEPDSRKGSWFGWVRGSPRVTGPSEELVKELREATGVDIEQYNEQTNKLIQAADTTLSDISTLEKELEKALQYIQCTHDAIGKIAELQESMSEIDGLDRDGSLCTDLVKKYDDYMLTHKVEEKINTLLSLKAKRAALLWAIPELERTTQEEQGKETARAKPTFITLKGGDLRGMMK